MARDMRLDSTKGVLVAGVRAGGSSALAEPALAAGDVIKSIDSQPIDDFKSAVARYESIMKSEPLPEYLLIEFQRSGKDQVTLIKPKPDKREDPPREVPKSWIGVAVQPVLKDLAAKLGHADTLGFRITRVYPGTTAAAQDKLAVGDIITAVNGETLSPRGMQDTGLFQRKIRTLPISQPAALTVLRGDQTVQVQMPLERTRIGPDEARHDENKDFELVVRELTFFDRDDNRWTEAVKGVWVDGAERAGWAGLAGIHPGDLIQKIGDYDVTDLPSYRKAMEAITKAQPPRVAFLILRDVRTHFKFVEPDWKPVTKEEAQQGKDTQGKDQDNVPDKPPQK
jgi:S1-C subfamily serine protease